MSNDILARRNFLRLGLLSAAAVPLVAPTLIKAATCVITPADALGPYYTKDARFAVNSGKGLKIWGRVMDSASCAVISGATIERWHASPYGVYEDYYRCRMTSDANGGYAFETHMPAIYAARPRHVHYRITAPGYKELVTQSYFPAEQAGGQPETEINFDFVLEKA